MTSTQTVALLPQTKQISHLLTGETVNVSKGLNTVFKQANEVHRIKALLNLPPKLETDSLSTYLERERENLRESRLMIKNHLGRDLLIRLYRKLGITIYADSKLPKSYVSLDGLGVSLTRIPEPLPEHLQPDQYLNHFRNQLSVLMNEQTNLILNRLVTEYLTGKDSNQIDNEALELIINS